jgi:hypothetical protein
MKDDLNKCVATSITLKHNNYIICKEKGINLSAYVNLCLERDYLSREHLIKKLQQEIEEKTKEIERIKQKIIDEKNKTEEYLKALSPEIVQELKNTLEIIGKSGDTYLEGRWKRYLNISQQQITMIEFKELLSKFKDIYREDIL